MNDPTCVSTSPPVLLLHGTFSRIKVDFQMVLPALLDQGLCVYGKDYGLLGTGAVKDSATSFASFANEVLQVTGATKLDVIGYSQGGLVLRTAMRFNDLAGSVRAAVMIAPSFHGTTSSLLSILPSGTCPGCTDQKANSALLQELAVGGDTETGVQYAVAVISTDQIVTPWESQLPVGSADQVVSVVVNQVCANFTAVHENLLRSAAVVRWVSAAVTSGGRPTPADLGC